MLVMPVQHVVCVLAVLQFQRYVRWLTCTDSVQPCNRAVFAVLVVLCGSAAVLSVVMGC